MTTKIKIIAGFMAMVLLIAVLAVIGYTSLQTSSTNFIEYRRLARLNVATSDMVAAVSKGQAAILGFFTTANPAKLQEAQKSYDAMEALCQLARDNIKKKERFGIVDRMEEGTGTLVEHLGEIQDNFNNTSEVYRSVVIPDSRDLEQLLWKLNESAVVSNDMAKAQSVGEAIQLLRSVSVSLATLSGGLDINKNQTIPGSLLALNKAVGDIAENLAGSTDRELHEQAKAKLASLSTAATAIVNASKILQDDLTILATISETDIGKEINKLSELVNTEMNQQGTLTLGTNSQLQTVSLVVSGIGIVLGILIALFIIVGIVRILREMSNFAEAIAVGDFNYPVKIKEKGEVGAMVSAMQQIPHVLNQILDEYRRLLGRIETGYLDEAGDTSRFQGAFSTLIAGTNSILERFINVLNNIPSPVIAFDQSLRAAYINLKGREWTGNDYQGKSFDQLLCSDANTAGKNDLRSVLENKRSSTAEIAARPRGMNLDISYTAVPFTDNNDKVVSVIQFITDLTEIRSGQRMMVSVANQAAEISDRTSAASEELSAQVELVSRGAEMQRTRVESTASAMTEMNATVLEVARNASKASEQSELTRDKARNGAGLVNQVISAINSVDNISATMQKNMQELGSQAEKIGGVMNIISDIADQTNLLALNAAIEAARAGEAGRGFAVVADEVRKLAEKTMEATSEVGGNIAAIQESARTNIQAMSSAAKAVAEATSLAGSSGEALSEIVELASSSSAVVTSIAAAAEQQSAASEEINMAISEINQVVNETSDGMVQASSAVHELSEMTHDLNSLINELRK